MRSLFVLPLALLAGCSSSKTTDDPMITVVDTPDSIYQTRTPDAPVALSAHLPLGDALGGYVWLDGSPATVAGSGGTSDVSSRKVNAAQTALTDVQAQIGDTVDSLEIADWEAAVQEAVNRVAAQRRFDAALVRQVADRVLVAHGLHRGGPLGRQVAAAALVRLAEAGSPDATLALVAVGRLNGYVAPSVLAEAGGRVAAAATAWLARPFRPALLTAPVAGQTMRRSEVVAMREVELRVNGYAMDERRRLADAAAALARP